jgi:DNA-binding beta-propeller fold protein YncE
MRRARGLGRLTRGATVASLLLCALLALAASPALAAPADYLGSFGPDGSEATGFGDPTSLGVDQSSGAVYVGDSETQTLYKFDSEGNPLDWGGTAPYISNSEITGLAFRTTEPGENQIAVDPTTHVVYVTSGDRVRAFEANGEPHEFTSGPGEGTSEIPGAIRLNGVAVDAQGNIYASDSGEISGDPEFLSKRIRVYSSSGTLLLEFQPRQVLANNPIVPKNLAVAPDGALYVVTPGGVYRFSPSQGPISPATTYSQGVPLANEFSRSVAVDPTTSYVYISQFQVFEGKSIPRVGVYDDSGTFIGTLGAQGQPGELTGIPRGLAVYGAGKRAYVEAKGEPGVLAQVSVFEPYAFLVAAPTISATSVIDLDLHTATLRAQINPNTLQSTYHFEYGPEDCALGACASTAEGTIAPGHEDIGVSREIAGLQPGTTYHYRVVATNSEGTTEGPDKTFTTPLSGQGFGLADDRAWEMVSPPNKFGARIFQSDQGVMQAAADGNGVAYQSVTSIEPDPDGNRAIDSSTVLARRGAEGWRSKDVTPPHTEARQIRFGGDYKTFSPDLERALLEQPDDTLLSPEASEETPYLRENTEPPTYRPLVTGKEGFANVPEGTVFGGGNGSASSPVLIAAADPSLTHPVLKSIKAPLVPDAALESLYQWNDGQLQPVSELPASEGGGVVLGTAGAGPGSIRNAVSADGSRVFWGRGRYDSGIGSKMSGLYVRDTASQESWRLDVARPDASGEGEVFPAFEGASADGTVVFFSTQQQLTADASAPKEGTRDLYRCEVGEVEGGGLGCTSLIDLSAPLASSGERGEITGTVSGFSEDGSRAYFVARGVLDGIPNEFGESAVAGAHNLYLWEEGKGRRFIATLSNRDNADWGSRDEGSRQEVDRGAQAARLSAASSPSGRYLTFMSERNLTGYDNRDAGSEEPVEEAFRYDAIANRLTCVSCKPSGASPEGKDTGPDLSRADTQSNWTNRWVAAILPAAQESEPTVGLAFHQPRIALDNGRVFFNAIDSLVSADANGEWDVYQWEPTGVGDCTATSSGAAIARSAGGCVSLVSSGTGEEEATFLDASETGDDVFFLTPARLSVTDEDEELDVYDARVDGVPATLAVINECLGEACQPAPNPPNDPTPASAAFHGSGNVPSERCPASKRKVIRAGSARCVAKKHKKKKHSRKAKRAANNRRAGR